MQTYIEHIYIFKLIYLYRYYICRTLSLYIFIYISIEIYILYISVRIYILMFCSWGKAVKGQRFSNLKALTHPKLRQLNKHVGCTLCALQFDLNRRPPLLHQRQGLSYIYIHIYGKNACCSSLLCGTMKICRQLQFFCIYTTSFQYIDFCFICTCIC